MAARRFASIAFRSMRAVLASPINAGIRSFQAVRYAPARGFASAGTPSKPVFDVTTANFQKEVMQSKIPIILDCYADWCGPCKQLTPQLESAANRAKGLFRLAKLNTDNNPELSQGLRITSLPTVMALVDGKLIDRFEGVPPPARMQQFMQKLMQAVENVGNSATDQLDAIFAQAEELMAADQHLKAAEIYEKMLEAMSESSTDTEELTIRARALAGMARASLRLGNTEAAADFAERLHQAEYKDCQDHPDVVKARAAVELAAAHSDGSEEGSATNVEALRSALAANPSAECYLELARALVARGHYEEPVELCLQSIKLDRNHADGAAKALLFKVFDSLGEAHHAVKTGRRRLGQILF